jgi:hypothetical protein
MTKDEIIEMAKRAEMIQMTIGEWWGVELSDIEHFAKLVAEKEREACAKLVEGLPAPGDIRALKHRIHELEVDVLGYKKIVADQDAMLERQTARIVELQEHIENFDGEDR